LGKASRQLSKYRLQTAHTASTFSAGLAPGDDKVWVVGADDHGDTFPDVEAGEQPVPEPRPKARRLATDWFPPKIPGLFSILNKCWADAFFANRLPFSLANDFFFRKAVGMTHPGYQLPTAKELRRQFLTAADIDARDDGPPPDGAIRMPSASQIGTFCIAPTPSIMSATSAVELREVNLWRQ